MGRTLPAFCSPSRRRCRACRRSTFRISLQPTSLGTNAKSILRSTAARSHTSATVTNFPDEHQVVDCPNEVISEVVFFYVFMWVYLGLPGLSVSRHTCGCSTDRASDTEIAWSILQKSGYQRTTVLDDVGSLRPALTRQADVILAVTCAIRENAERKVWARLDLFRQMKLRRSLQVERPPLQVGVLGCMAGGSKDICPTLATCDQHCDM